MLIMMMSRRTGLRVNIIHEVYIKVFASGSISAQHMQSVHTAFQNEYIADHVYTCNSSGVGLARARIYNAISSETNLDFR